VDLRGRKVTGDWRRLRNFHYSPGIVTVIKSNMMRSMRHVARIGKMKNAYKIFVRKPQGKRTSG
jgi:transcription elongation factor